MKGKRGPPPAEGQPTQGREGGNVVAACQGGAAGFGRTSSSRRRQGRGLATDPASTAPGPAPSQASRYSRAPRSPGAAPPAGPAPRAPSSPIRSSLQVQQSSVNLMHTAGGGARRGRGWGRPGPRKLARSRRRRRRPGRRRRRRTARAGPGGLAALGASAAASRTPAPAPAPRRDGLGRDGGAGRGGASELRHGGGVGLGQRGTALRGPAPSRRRPAPPRPFIHLFPSANSLLGNTRRGRVNRRVKRRRKG